MPAIELTPDKTEPLPGVSYAVLGAAARWLGCLNAVGALAEVGFVLGLLGPDVAPPDLSLPLALFLAGVLASGSAMLCWGMAQASRSAGRACSRRVTAANWIGAVAYASGLLAFAAACWASAVLGLGADGASLSATSVAYVSMR